MQWPKQRAWGWYATLIRTPWFCVKLLRFKPHGALSMQRHFHRTEIWLFMRGFGWMFQNGINRAIYSGGYISKINPNDWHRFLADNRPVYVLELQYGRKVTETDIERKND